jgi:hypothetical protein
MFGRYTADLTLGYGTKGEAITGETSFWVIPYRLILVSLLIVVTVVFVLTRVIRMYNNYIIQAAKKQNEKKPNEKKPKSKTTTKKK